jgi:hypothetical protein
LGKRISIFTVDSVDPKPNLLLNPETKPPKNFISKPLKDSSQSKHSTEPSKHPEG